MSNKTAFSPANVEQGLSYALLGKKEAPGLDTPCRLHIHSRRYRLVDADGVSGKAAIDGIVISGLLPDDSAKEIKEITYSQEKIKKTEIEETIITIKTGD